MGEFPGLLVGREIELACLDAAVAKIGDCLPVIVELVGPAGIGKTSLLDRFAQTAAARGLQVVPGRGHRSEQGSAQSLVDI